MDIYAANNLKVQIIVLRAQSGSKSAFKELYELFHQATFKYLVSLINEADAQDVNQRVWLKVYQQLTKLVSPFGFKRWLMQMAHREAIDLLRRERKYSAFEQVDEQNVEQQATLVTTFELPTDYEHLHAAIKSLPFTQKEVLLLHYWQDFSCIEIAHILSCSEGTVKSRLFNARQKLQLINKVKGE